MECLSANHPPVAPLCLQAYRDTARSLGYPLAVVSLREPTHTQKSARKWQLRPFATSCAKDYEGHSLLLRPIGQVGGGLSLAEWPTWLHGGNNVGQLSKEWRLDRGYRRKNPERPWTAAGTMKVLRRCPLVIAQRLVHCAIAVSTAVLGQSHKDNVRCTAVEKQPEAKKV